MKDPSIIDKKLNERALQSSLRELKITSQLKDFSSNDYLGMSHNQEIKKMYDKKVLENGEFLLGGTGSRLLSGNSTVHEKTEDFLKDFFKGESALLFNSGYAANQGLISAIAGRNDTVIYDKLSHVCIKEGVWLSRANAYSYKHNDTNDLEEKLKKATGTIFVITETVFSMDGDIAPLKDIINLCKRYRAFLIVDEAHSTGIYGRGKGYLVEEEIENGVFARIYTFGKAVGYHGACIVGSDSLKKFLINFCRTFIYTTSLPPASVLMIHTLLEYIYDHPNLRNQLFERIELFKSNLSIITNSTTAIQPIIIPGSESCREVANILQIKGFDVRPILSPTVKLGEERVRVSLHIHNSPEDVKKLAEEINAVL